MKVKVVESSLVVPREETPMHRLWLSNLDLMFLRGYTVIVYYYPFNGEADFFSIERLKVSLAKALVPFYPLAGRLSTDGVGRLELDCNAQGVLFVVARADFTGAECFHDFKPSPEMQAMLTPCTDDPAGPTTCMLMIQVTVLKCGSVALGICTNHCIMDGKSNRIFLQAWTAIARGLDHGPSPCHDRTPLRARFPPVVQFPHPEYSFPVPVSPTAIVSCNVTLSQEQEDALESLCAGPRGATASSFCSITAYVWRCMCVARGLAADSEFHVFAPVDIRRRLQPPLSQNFFGNALTFGLVVAKVGDILSKPIAFAAEKIKTALDRIDDEYLRSGIDYLEHADTTRLMRRDQMPENYMWVTSWLNMGVLSWDFGWGNPQMMVRPEMRCSGYVHVVSRAKKDGGVTLVLGLEPERAELFKKVFYDGAASLQFHSNDKNHHSKM